MSRRLCDNEDARRRSLGRPEIAPVGRTIMAPAAREGDLAHSAASGVLLALLLFLTRCSPSDPDVVLSQKAPRDCREVIAIAGRGQKQGTDAVASVTCGTTSMRAVHCSHVAASTLAGPRTKLHQVCAASPGAAVRGARAQRHRGHGQRRGALRTALLAPPVTGCQNLRTHEPARRPCLALRQYVREHEIRESVESKRFGGDAADLVLDGAVVALSDRGGMVVPVIVVRPQAQNPHFCTRWLSFSSA